MIVLTDEEWDVVEDALAEMEVEALQQADMWAGRVREPRYRREAEKADAIRQKINKQRSEDSPRG